jgi:hypothetical protein
MVEAATITPDPPANQGLDYAWLRAEGTRLAQALSGAIWTDYNEHDPGVTTLEQLCYALTELSYRAEFPLETLLIDPHTRRIDTRRQALFVPRRILPGAPLTENDYRKLIVDRVPGVANVWLTPRPGTPDGIDGLYDIAVYAPDADPCCCDGDGHLRPEVVAERVRRVYCAHRCLCEDVHDVRLLEAVAATVSGAVVIDNSLAAEQVMARLLFNLGNFLAPELRRTPLDALIAAGLPSTAIFNGPLLRRGFIDDCQLAPRPKAVLLPDIVRLMARTAGVMAVRKVVLRIGDAVASGAGAPAIPLPPGTIPRLQTAPVDGCYPIRLWRNGIEVTPDPARVERELARLWKEYRREYPLARQYAEYFAVPEGEPRNLRSYYSIQNQYPNVYGINAYGLPENATAARKGQAKQLKGYLLAFEQMLADFFAQLAEARTLYAIDDPAAPTYFYQYLDRSVPNVHGLLKEGYRAGLAHIVSGSDDVAARRNRFFDLLLALYAERLDGDLMPFLTYGEHAGGRLLRAKHALLQHLVAATRDRGIGFDYAARPSPHNIAGMAIRSRIELGMTALPRRRLGERLEETGLALADDDERPPTIGSPLGAHADHIEETFTAADALPEAERSGGTDRTLAEQAAAALRGQRVHESFLRGLADGDIRLGAMPGDSMVTAVCRATGDSEWRLIGKYATRERALAVLALLIALARDLLGGLRQLYIVEHLLLRFARWGSRDRDAAGSPPDAADGFPYSFTVTAVVSDAPHGSGVQGYRAGVAQVIRRNAPAHVAVTFCFLRPHRMANFESLYYAWRRALRQGDRSRIAAASRHLQDFLERAAAVPAGEED